MSNFYSISRSNYFQVKNELSFQKWAEINNLEWWTKEKVNSSLLYAIAPLDNNGEWPTTTSKDEEFHIEIELAKYLLKDEVAVLVSIGSEKLRLIDGYSVAIHSSGETIDLSLNDIYKQAATAFNKDKNEIQIAEY